jgi:hypothetical protein
VIRDPRTRALAKRARGFMRKARKALPEGQGAAERFARLCGKLIADGVPIDEEAFLDLADEHGVWGLREHIGRGKGETARVTIDPDIDLDDDIPWNDAPMDEAARAAHAEAVRRCCPALMSPEAWAAQIADAERVSALMRERYCGRQERVVREFRLLVDIVREATR